MNTPSQFAEKLSAYEKLMRLDKPIGILLLLWPTLWALWLSARGTPELFTVWIFILGTVLMRSAGCVINDYADRDIDPHVQRTRERPLATGLVNKKEALILFTILILAAFCVLIPIINRLLLGLSVAALFLAASYPYCKRFLSIPQAYLGIAFGFGIPMAYAAQTQSLPLEAGWLLLANIFWAIAYDTEYAMVDREDDRKIGIKTSALTFGRFDVLAVMICYALALILIAALGFRLHLGLMFYLGIASAAVMAIYHYYLIKNRDPEQCFKAFSHNNWLGAAIFCGIFLDSLPQFLRALTLFSSLL